MEIVSCQAEQLSQSKCSKCRGRGTVRQLVISLWASVKLKFPLANVFLCKLSRRSMKQFSSQLQFLTCNTSILICEPFPLPESSQVSSFLSAAWSMIAFATAQRTEHNILKRPGPGDRSSPFRFQWPISQLLQKLWNWLRYFNGAVTVSTGASADQPELKSLWLEKYFR